MTIEAVSLCMPSGQSPVRHQTRKMATPPKKLSVSLSVAQKINILDHLKDCDNHKTIIAETGIGMHSLERIIQQETEIRNDGGNLNKKRKRNGNNEEVEEAVSTWFTAVRSKIEKRRKKIEFLV